MRKEEPEDTDESEVETEDETDEEEEGTDTDSIPDADEILEKMPTIEWPAAVTLVAKKFSGKSNVILNMVDKKDFDNIVVVSGSAVKIGNEMATLAKPKNAVTDKFHDDMLWALFQHAKKIDKDSKGKKMARILVIFDDFIGLGWNPQTSEALARVSSQGRHYGLSLIFSSQTLVHVPTVVRRNTEYWLVGNNTEEVSTQFAKDLAIPALPGKLLRERLYDIARKKNYEFMYMDDRKQEFARLKLPLLLKK